MVYKVFEPLRFTEFASFTGTVDYKLICEFNALAVCYVLIISSEVEFTLDDVREGQNDDS